MYKHTTINFIFFVLIIILLAKKVFLLNMDTLYNTFQFSIILAKSYISSICKSPVCKEVDNYILCKGREFQFFMNPLDSLITRTSLSNACTQSLITESFISYILNSKILELLESILLSIFN